MKHLRVIYIKQVLFILDFSISTMFLKISKYHYIMCTPRDLSVVIFHNKFAMLFTVDTISNDNCNMAYITDYINSSITDHYICASENRIMSSGMIYQTVSIPVHLSNLH